jgi:hypothetical protein
MLGSPPEKITFRRRVKPREQKANIMAKKPAKKSVKKPAKKKAGKKK